MMALSYWQLWQKIKFLLNQKHHLMGRHWKVDQNENLCLENPKFCLYDGPSLG